MYGRLNALKEKLSNDKAVKASIEKNILEYKVKMRVFSGEIATLEKAALLISNVSLQAKQSIVAFLEDIVTDALVYISEGQYKFKIEIEDSAKSTKCEFYLIEDIDGVESKQKPQDSCGGGFIDVISTTLRYAYLNLYNDPKLMGPVILDEPGKMVSQAMSVKFAEFIKKLGAEFDRQTIMITHNDNLSNIADNTIDIIKTN